MWIERVAAGSGIVNVRDARVFWTLSIAHLVNDAYVFFLPTLLPILIPSLGISLTLAGLAVGVYQMTSSVAQPLLGHLADRYALRWMSYLGVLAVAIGAGGIGVAPNYWLLLILLVLGGLGTSAFHPVGTATVSDIKRGNRGWIMSVYITAGNLGLAVGPAALGFALPKWGPVSTVFLAIPCALMALALYLTVPAREVTERQRASLASVLSRHRRVLAKLLGVAGLRAWANAAVATFLPLLLIERGRSIEDGALALTLLLLFGGLGGLIGGSLSDRFGRDAVIVVSLLLSPPCALLMLYGAGPWLWVGAALVGLTLNGAMVPLTVRGQEAMPDSVAMVSGIMLGFSVGVGGLAVTPMAALAEQFGLETVAAAGALLPLPAAALALTLKGERPTRHSEAQVGTRAVRSRRPA
jgi:FSR family fosmidomycin resistance protein-like MFS transporter